MIIIMYRLILAFNISCTTIAGASLDLHGTDIDEAIILCRRYRI